MLYAEAKPHLVTDVSQYRHVKVGALRPEINLVFVKFRSGVLHPVHEVLHNHVDGLAGAIRTVIVKKGCLCFVILTRPPVCRTLVEGKAVQKLAPQVYMFGKLR